MTALSATLAGRVGELEIQVELRAADGPLVLIGPNGAGKTSVLLMLLGVLPVARGRVTVGDEVLLDTATGRDLPAEARALGYVPQNYGLFPHLDVAENVAFSLGRAARREQVAVRAALAEFELTELALRSVAELSGGERQRVALARAFVARSRALFLDEPLSALDVGARRRVREVLVGILRKWNEPCVIVTHDPADAIALGHRIAVIEAGRVSQTGTWKELSAAPASDFVAEFVRPFGAAPL